MISGAGLITTMEMNRGRVYYEHVPYAWLCDGVDCGYLFINGWDLGGMLFKLALPSLLQGPVLWHLFESCVWYLCFWAIHPPLLSLPSIGFYRCPRFHWHHHSVPSLVHQMSVLNERLPFLHGWRGLGNISLPVIDSRFPISDPNTAMGYLRFLQVFNLI